MIWGGTSIEGCTHLCSLVICTPTAIRYQHEIFGPTVRSYAGEVAPGFLLVHDSSWPCVERLSRQFLEDEGFDTAGLPPHSPALNPTELLWDIVFRSVWLCQVATMLSGMHTRMWGPYKLLSTVFELLRQASAFYQNFIAAFLLLRFERLM